MDDDACNPVEYDQAAEASKKKTKKPWQSVVFSDTQMGRNYFSRCCAESYLRQLNGRLTRIKCNILAIRKKDPHKSIPLGSSIAGSYRAYRRTPTPRWQRASFLPKEGPESQQPPRADPNDFVLEPKAVRYCLAVHPDIQVRCIGCQQVLPSDQVIHLYRPPNWPSPGYRLCEPCHEKFTG